MGPSELRVVTLRNPDFKKKKSALPGPRLGRWGPNGTVANSMELKKPRPRGKTNHKSRGGGGGSRPQLQNREAKNLVKGYGGVDSQKKKNRARIRPSGEALRNKTPEHVSGPTVCWTGGVVWGRKKNTA